MRKRFTIVVMIVLIMLMSGLTSEQVKMIFAESGIASNIDQGGALSSYTYVRTQWQNPSNVTGNGVLYTVRFRVKEGLPDGKTSLTLTYKPGDVADQSLNTISIAVTNADMTIKSKKILYGDIKQDGFVNTIDAIKLSQYLAGWTVPMSEDELEAADVRKDGVVNTIDAIKLAQYLAGWKGIVLGE